MNEIAMTASFMRLSVYQKIFASCTGPRPSTRPARMAATKHPVPVAESQLKSNRAASGVSFVTTGAARVTALCSSGTSPTGGGARVIAPLPPRGRGRAVDRALDRRQAPHAHRQRQDGERHPRPDHLSGGMLVRGRGAWRRLLVREAPHALRPPEPEEDHRRNERHDAAGDVDQVRVHVVGPEVLRQAERSSHHENGGQHLEGLGPPHHGAHQPEGHDDPRDGQDAADHGAQIRLRQARDCRQRVHRRPDRSPRHRRCVGDQVERGGVERLESAPDVEGARDRARPPEARRTFDERSEAERHQQQLQPAVGGDARHRFLHDLELAGEYRDVVEIHRREHDPGDLQHAEPDAVQEAHAGERGRHPENQHSHEHRGGSAGDGTPVRLYAQPRQQAEQHQDRECGDESGEDPIVQRIVHLGPRHGSVPGFGGAGKPIRFLPGGKAGSNQPSRTAHNAARTRPEASWLCPAIHSRGAACSAPAPTTSETATAALCSPPSVPRSSMPPSGVRRNAWVTGSPRASLSPVWLDPTMWPASLMALAQLVRPPSVPRSTMPARAVHRNAWPLPPTTSVRLLMPSAMLAAPSSPRSRRPSVAVHTNARGSPVLVSDKPTTAPSSFRSWAMLVVPPRVPRSIIVPGAAMTKACFAGAPAPRLCPATWPRRLTASASLSFPPSVPRSKLVPADSREA